VIGIVLEFGGDEMTRTFFVDTVQQGCLRKTLEVLGKAYGPLASGAPMVDPDGESISIVVNLAGQLRASGPWAVTREFSPLAVPKPRDRAPTFGPACTGSRGW
jgi:hypothetical protein